MMTKAINLPQEFTFFHQTPEFCGVEEIGSNVITKSNQRQVLSKFSLQLAFHQGEQVFVQCAKLKLEMSKQPGSLCTGKDL